MKVELMTAEEETLFWQTHDPVAYWKERAMLAEERVTTLKQDLKEQHQVLLDERAGWEEVYSRKFEECETLRKRVEAK